MYAVADWFNILNRLDSPKLAMIPKQDNKINSHSANCSMLEFIWLNIMFDLWKLSHYFGIVRFRLAGLVQNNVGRQYNNTQHLDLLLLKLLLWI